MEPVSPFNVVEFAAVEIVESTDANQKMFTPLVFLCYDEKNLTGTKFAIPIQHADPHELLADVVDWISHMVPQVTKFARIVYKDEDPLLVDLDQLMPTYYEDREDEEGEVPDVKSPLELAEDIMARIESKDVFVVRGNNTKH